MFEKLTIRLLILSLLSIRSFTCLGQQENTTLSKPIFYGKVVDQYGNPVDGAVINLGIKVAGKDKKAAVETITVKSNKDGVFETANAGDVYIRTIEKTGYEFLDKSNLDFSLIATQPKVFLITKGLIL